MSKLKILSGPTLTFTRKKKRGMNQKVSRLWLTPEGYRLTWRKEFMGVSLPPRYQACVRTHQPGNFEKGYTENWDFVNRKRPLFKTAKAAIDECERHKRIWSKATQCPGIRALRALFDGRLPSNLPIWVRSKLNRKLLHVIIDTTPHRGAEEDDEPTDQPLPEPEPELEAEGKKHRRRKKRVSEEPREPGKRRTRSDKGKKRGPRKSAEPATEPTTEPTGPRKRRTRSDKGKKRGPRGPYGPRKPKDDSNG